MPQQLPETTDSLLEALASQKVLSQSAACGHGYDQYVLQQAIELMHPYLPHVGGYKPLLVWLRGSESYPYNVTSKDDLKQHRNIRLIFTAYVNTNKPGDKQYEVQTIQVFISKDGSYLVCITETPEKFKQVEHNRELTTSVKICSAAGQIADIINPMRLQLDRYSEYDEYYRLRSPVTRVADEVIKLLSDYLSELIGLQKKIKESVETLKGMRAKIE